MANGTSLITDAQHRMLFEGIAGGLTPTKAASAAGISRSSAYTILKNHPDGGRYYKAERSQQGIGDAKEYDQLSEEAQRALVDFGYFQHRYFGRVAVPWQVEAAEQIVELLEKPSKEYAIINAPPGVGKSTTFTHDIPAWLTCRNRAIRGLIGSITGKLAADYVAQLRKTLENLIPVLASDEDKMLGIAEDAITTLSADFGRFKPTDQDIWTRAGFVVAQKGNIFTRNKEATWAGVGRDQEFIGGRFDFCIWDDLVSEKSIRTIEQVNKDRSWWMKIAERRLEPAGLLVLQGQRLGPDDMYSWCRDMPAPTTRKALTAVGDKESPRKYKHIVYKAHYEEQCNGHEDDDEVMPEPYPKGCLLYPARLPWKELYAIKEMDSQTYETVFQQQDSSPDEVLVNPAWIAGGPGFPGCWDKDRDRLEFPRGLTGQVYSMVSCDPSPTQYWAIEWWLYHPDSDQRWLIDLERRGMDAPDFLEWNALDGRYTGIMEEWQQTSRDLGIPITHWIVEDNSANRFLLQYTFVREWQAKNSTQIIPHTTHRNKSDPNFGIQTIAPHYKFGRVRLPGKASSMGRLAAMKLVNEVTRYPRGVTDDTVLAHWFFEYQLQFLATPQVQAAPDRRPSWLLRRAS